MFAEFSIWDIVFLFFFLTFFSVSPVQTVRYWFLEQKRYQDLNIAIYICSMREMKPVLHVGQTMQYNVVYTRTWLVSLIYTTTSTDLPVVIHPEKPSVLTTKISATPARALPSVVWDCIKWYSTHIHHPHSHLTCLLWRTSTQYSFSFFSCAYDR